MPDDVSEHKAALRAELRQRRRDLTPEQRDSAASGIADNLKKLVREIGTTYIAAYLSTPNEPGTRAFLGWACREGIRVLLPISRADGLLDWATYDGEEEETDVQGMPAPTSEILAPRAIDDVGLILVPAATVDRVGMRMGWGGGYFDKTLGSMEKCPPVYAVIFDEELVAYVPSEVHDKKVNGVVTPTEIVRFS
jgi:5-formyltetrahydrofolate cyclo-ligase